VAGSRCPTSRVQRAGYPAIRERAAAVPELVPGGRDQLGLRSRLDGQGILEQAQLHQGVTSAATLPQALIPLVMDLLVGGPHLLDGLADLRLALSGRVSVVAALRTSALSRTAGFLALPIFARLVSWSTFAGFLVVCR
jgi:hypothetical protein